MADEFDDPNVFRGWWRKEVEKRLDALEVRVSKLERSEVVRDAFFASVRWGFPIIVTAVGIIVVAVLK